jgi:hypothetical protein
VEFQRSARGLTGADGAGALPWPGPDSRVTRGHLASVDEQPVSSSKRPWGFTCSQIGGVKARQSLTASFPDHHDRAATAARLEPRYGRAQV